MSFSYLFDPNKQFQDRNGVNNVGGFLRVYIDGTDDRATTYKDFNGTLNEADIMLDTDGRAVVIVDDNLTFRIEVYERDGALQWTVTQFTARGEGGGGGSSTPVVVDGTANEIDVTESMTAGVKYYTIGLATVVKNTLLGLLASLSNLVGILNSKTDKVQGATAGNIAALDASGNLTDSGSKISDFKTKQTAVPDPSASGTGLEFIDSISQDANGEITPHKKSVQDGTTAQKGIVQLQDSIGSTESATDKAVTPHAVREAINSAVSSAYHAAGTKSVAQLTSSLLVAENEGCVYNITDSGTTTSDFVDGAGHPINAGDNVGVCDVGGGVYKFDLLSGFVDLTNYLTKTGDASNATSTLTKASGDTSTMTSGSKLSVIFTAISSFFASLKALAFKDKASYNDLSSGVQSSLDKADSALQSHQSVTDNNPTLAWNTRSKVGTIGGTDLHVTMPSNPASGKADKANITGATKCKITYNGQGIVTSGADLDASDIPNLSASKTTSGTFDAARIPTSLPNTIVKAAKNVNGIPIGSSAIDLNNLNASGDSKISVYEWWQSNKNNVSNKPTDQAGTLIVFGYDANNCCQICEIAGVNNLFYRGRNASGWNAWTRLVVASKEGVGSTTTPVYVDSNGQVQPCTQGATLKSNTATLYIAGYTDNNIPYYHVKDIKNGCVNHVDFSGITDSTCDITFEAPTLSTGEEYDYIISLEGYTNNSGYSTGANVENCKQILRYISDGNLWVGEGLFLQATDWRQICVVRGNTCEWKRVALS